MPRPIDIPLRAERALMSMRLDQALELRDHINARVEDRLWARILELEAGIADARSMNTELRARNAELERRLLEITAQLDAEREASRLLHAEITELRARLSGATTAHAGAGNSAPSLMQSAEADEVEPGDALAADQHASTLDAVEAAPGAAQPGSEVITDGELADEQSTMAEGDEVEPGTSGPQDVVEPFLDAEPDLVLASEGEGEHQIPARELAPGDADPQRALRQRQSLRREVYRAREEERAEVLSATGFENNLLTESAGRLLCDIDRVSRELGIAREKRLSAENVVAQLKRELEMRTPEEAGAGA